MKIAGSKILSEPAITTFCNTDLPGIFPAEIEIQYFQNSLAEPIQICS